MSVVLTPDARHAGGRYNRIYVRRPADGVLVRFTGESIPGLLVVLSSEYDKNGKWSSTAYTVELAAGAVAFELLRPLHQEGVFTQCSSWAEAYELVVTAAGGPVAGFEAWLRAEYPAAAERLDAVAAALDVVEEASADQAAPALIEIRVGPFVRRERHLAAAPIDLRSPSGETATITRESGSPALAASWCRLVGVQRLPGHGGGTEILQVAAPEGTSWEIQGAPGSTW